MSSLSKYFDDFFDEKEIPWKMWEIRDASDNVHMIDTDFVIAAIKGTSGVEAETIARTLRMIDFLNKPVLPYLETLAIGYVLNLEKKK